jgi:hypothetical protein
VLYTADDAARLGSSGFTWTVTIPDLGLRETQINELNAAYAKATAVSPLPSGRDTYRTLGEYEADLRALAAANPGLVRLFTLSRRSLEGREIVGVEISDNVAATGDGKPVFLMMGLHHARAWPSGEHSIEFAIDLVKGYTAGNARITDLLKRTRVQVVPVVNPDGFEQSRKWGDLVDIREIDDGGTVTILANPGSAYKRKNCRVADGVDPTPPGACEVSSPGGYGTGVDLNRNYGGLWGGPGAADLFADPTYRGAGPFSEPETQAVRELISSRHVTTLITNHTFSNLVLRPPGIRSAGETVDEAAMKDLGGRMSAQNGYRNIHGWQRYDTTGTTEDWSYNATGGFGYTFEIGPNEFHPPFSQMVDEYLGAGIYTGKGNREAFLIALENAADARQHSVITGRAPADAVLRLTKSFQTATSSAGTIDDRLESTLVVAGGRFTWHVNPSTRPEVMEHRVRILAQEPTRQETTTKSAVVWAPGDHVDVPFSMPEADVGALKVTLDWPDTRRSRPRGVLRPTRRIAPRGGKLGQLHPREGGGARRAAGARELRAPRDQLRVRLYHLHGDCGPLWQRGRKRDGRWHRRELHAHVREAGRHGAPDGEGRRRPRPDEEGQPLDLPAALRPLRVTRRRMTVG